MEPFTLCIRPIINNQEEEDVYMRKMVSKILSICMVGIILTSSLAGCGSKDSKNSKLDAKESVDYAESRVEMTMPVQ